MWGYVPPPLECHALGVLQGRLTKRDDDGAGDAVRHHHAEDVQHPRVLPPVLEIRGLVLGQKAGVTSRWPGPLGVTASLQLRPRQHSLPALEARKQPPVHARRPPRVPILVPSPEKLRAVPREGPGLTFLMWTLAGSDLEKKRRVLYMKRDPRRSSSMPVPSKAAVIT